MSTYGYLAHHGVKGQKWGIRRYQKSDGTLTEEGKRRYGITNSVGPTSSFDLKNEKKYIYRNIRKEFRNDLNKINSDSSLSVKERTQQRRNVLEGYAGYGKIVSNTLKKKYGDKAYNTLTSLNYLNAGLLAVNAVTAGVLGTKLIKDINEDYAITDRRNIYSYQAETIPEVIKREIGF